jgi:hypothetical protein
MEILEPDPQLIGRRIIPETTAGVTGTPVFTWLQPTVSHQAELLLQNLHMEAHCSCSSNILRS